MKKMMLLILLPPLNVFAILKKDVVIPESDINFGELLIFMGSLILFIAIALLISEIKNKKKK